MDHVCLPRWWEKVTLPLPLLNDEEGAKVAADLPPVVDAHVHVFPDRVLEAIYRWFDKNAWPIRYKLLAEEIAQSLFSRGVSRVVALHYAHKPGMARALNRFVAELQQKDPRILGLATVYPGEEGAKEILEEAFALGLHGVKLHCHVQCFAPDAEALQTVYETCARANKALVMHAGREPALPQYPCDPYELCAVERVENVLRDHPALKLCVAHLGGDEFEGYERLLRRFDHLWLDTTIALADYLPFLPPPPKRMIVDHTHRILYGSDYPILPFAWDRELRKLSAFGLDDDGRARVLGQNALALFTGR
jgi:predicted TIM-barrel fold metal-dependent hydrolase